jgi:hypothetical protein
MEEAAAPKVKGNALRKERAHCCPAWRANAACSVSAGTPDADRQAERRVDREVEALGEGACGLELHLRSEMTRTTSPIRRTIV